jgi:hypothetical protein
MKTEDIFLTFLQIGLAASTFLINNPFKWIIAVTVEILTDQLYLLSTCWDVISNISGQSRFQLS